MDHPNHLPKDHPMYEARLRAQHGMALGLASLPGGVVAGLLLGLPIAGRVAGFPLGLLSGGVASVLLGLGVGLLGLAVAQGARGLAAGFWTLRHAMEELSGEQRLAWFTALAGLAFLGLALGYALAFALA